MLRRIFLAVIVATPLGAQSLQYRSPAGVEYRSERDTGTVARAEKALVADPGNVHLSLAHLAHACLRGSERDIELHVLGVGRDRRLRVHHRARVHLRPVLNTGGRLVL